MEFEKDILNCLQVLRLGGLIIYPTDTVWGIGCDATNAKAVERVYSIKRRSDTKAMIVLVADEKDVLRYVTQPDLEVFGYLKRAPKPTTVVYEGAVGLAENLVSSDGSIAIRVCREEFCRHLIKRFGKPVVSTSANLSGQPSPKIFRDISEEMKMNVDYVVSYRQSETAPAEPSALIRWEKGKPVFLRP